MQVAYGIDCALKLAKRSRIKTEKAAAKEDRKATREAKERLKTKRDYMKEAQQAVNKYVRERDKDLPCISCGRYHQGQWHAGHYLSRGAHPGLSLDPRNIAKQCAPCNTHLSGNQANFRLGLIARNGLDLVEWLEGPHLPNHYSIEQLKIIASEYKIKFNQLSKRNQIEQ